MMDCNKYPQIVWKWALAILIIRCNLQFGGGLGGNSEHVVGWLASRSHFDHPPVQHCQFDDVNSLQMCSNKDRICQ